MIIQPARIVIIDNDVHHLKSLTDTLSGMGSACLPFHYQEDHPEPKLLQGARFIFCDLHLISDTVTTDKKQQYSNIASMLLSGLDKEHGPYVLVIWSEFPNEVTELNNYFDELEPGQRPVKCCVLDKNDYIHTESKPGEKSGDLSGAVAKLFEDIPGLSALMKWENKVSTAASTTTSALWSLCEGANETERDISLRNTLGILAKGTSGEKTAKKQPGRGVVEALSPLLSDQLEKSEIDEKFWKTAVEFDKPGKAVSGANLYSMLYFESTTSHNSLERGAICSLADGWATDGDFKAKFGFSKEEVLGQFGYKGQKLTDAKNDAQWYFVQLNAACDQAQDNPGFIPYVLGCTVSGEVKKTGKPNGSVWCSQPLALNGKEQLLFCHGRFIVGMTKREAKNLEVKLRIRAHLLDQMVQDIRAKSSRLGVIEPH